MGKRKNPRILACVILAPAMIFFLSIQTSGAGKDTSQSKNYSVSQPKLISKTVPIPSKPAAPSPSSFRPDMPFAEAVDILRNSVKPPLNIAVLWKDFRLAQGAILIVAVSFVLVNLLVDVSYVWLDPRVRYD